MRVRTFALALLASLVSVSALQAQVAGAEVVDKATTFQEALAGVVVIPMTQGEIDYLLENVEPVTAWAADNVEAWDAIDDADEPIPALKSLGVWDATGVSATSFLAILIKTQIANQVANRGLSAEMLNNQIGQAEQALDSGMIPAEQMAEVEEQLEVARELAVAMESYPAENAALYEANAEALAAALQTFNQATDGAGEGADEGAGEGGDEGDDEGGDEG